METSGEHLRHAPREHVLFVHAHPDDEAISTGGTIATIVERHGHVTVLTCTRGERGEVIPADLSHLEHRPKELAACRENELAAALEVLGVTDHRFLGAPGARWSGRAPRVYLDSGMRWGSAGAEALDDLEPDSFAGADFAEATTDIAAVIAEVEPTAVVSYDHRGGYGHPDHIRAHHAARRAADVMGVPFFAIVETASEDAVDPSAGDIVVDVSNVVGRKRAALEAHRTQVSIIDERSFALSSGPPRPIGEVEVFRRLHREKPRLTHDYADQGRAAKTVTAAIALAVGIAAGATLTIIHQSSLRVGDLVVPTGLVAGLAVLLALILGLRLVFGTRVVPGAAALGALLAIAVLSLPSAGGSILVPAGLVGYAWIFGPTLIAVVVLAWPTIVLPPTRPDERYGGVPPMKGSLPE